MVSMGELSMTLDARLQVNPEGVDWVDRSATPVNPEIACSVIVDVPCELASTRAGVTGPANIEKSATVKLNILEWGPAEPLVPATVTE